MKKLLPVFFIVFTLLFFYFFFTASIISAAVDLECKPKDFFLEQNSRPAPCNICNITNLLTPSCATSFEIFDEIKYSPLEAPTIKKSWEGEITVNPKEIIIPFVGKENQESEFDYLADYLEGTNEYYNNYQNQNTITNYQGVLRKLTPMGYQDQAKRELVTRAEEGVIHDYKVKYTDRFCWSASLLTEIIDYTIEKIVKGLADILDIKKPNWSNVTQYCLYETNARDWIIKNIVQLGFKVIPPFIAKGEIKDGGIVNLTELKPPPDLNEENYQKKYLKWKNEDGGKWYRLWQAAPMLSREDTQGEISPFLAKEHGEDSKLEFVSEESKLESVPHLVRLYEGSQIISNILTPTSENKIEMIKSEVIPETTPPNTCFKENYILTNEGDNLCCEPIKATFKAVEEFENPLYEKCQSASPSASCYVPNTKDVSRGFGVNLKHPYLDEIWSYTANANGGFLNIFRPYGHPTFEDIDTAQTISYSYNPKGLTSSGDVSPTEGLFFFPHLGGVQKAKEWVVNQALWPYEK